MTIMCATLPHLPSLGIPDFSAFIVELSTAFFLTLTWQCLHKMSRDGWSSDGEIGQHEPALSRGEGCVSLG